MSCPSPSPIEHVQWADEQATRRGANPIVDHEEASLLRCHSEPRCSVTVLLGSVTDRLERFGEGIITLRDGCRGGCRLAGVAVGVGLSTTSIGNGSFIKVALCFLWRAPTG